MIVSKTLSDEVTIQDCFQSVDWHWPIDTGNRCRGFTADDGAQARDFELGDAPALFYHSSPASASR